MKMKKGRRNGTVAVPPDKEPLSAPKKVLRGISAWMVPLRRLYRVSQPFFVERHSRANAWGSVLVIVALMITSTQVNIWISHALNHYMSVVSGQPKEVDEGWFVDHLVWLLTAVGAGGRYLWLMVFLILLAVIDPVQVFLNYRQTRLTLDWRVFLTRKYVVAQFVHMVAWLMKRAGVIENPDQRMTDNVKDFAVISVALFLALVQAVITMLMWTPDLWRISALLTVTVYGWTLFVSVASSWIGKPLVRLIYRLSECEADLRFTLQEAWRQAETIAQTDGEQNYQQQALLRLLRLAGVQTGINVRTAWVQALTTYANGLVPWMAPILIAPLFLEQGVGAMWEATAAVTSLFGAIAVVANQLPIITNYLALAERLDDLQEAQEKHAKEPVPPRGEG